MVYTVHEQCIYDLSFIPKWLQVINDLSRVVEFHIQIRKSPNKMYPIDSFVRKGWLLTASNGYTSMSGSDVVCRLTVVLPLRLCMSPALGVTID